MEGLVKHYLGIPQAYFVPFPLYFDLVVLELANGHPLVRVSYALHLGDSLLDARLTDIAEHTEFVVLLQHCFELVGRDPELAGPFHSATRVFEQSRNHVSEDVDFLVRQRYAHEELKHLSELVFEEELRVSGRELQKASID